MTGTLPKALSFIDHGQPILAVLVENPPGAGCLTLIETCVICNQPLDHLPFYTTDPLLFYVHAHCLYDYVVAATSAAATVNAIGFTNSSTQSRSNRQRFMNPSYSPATYHPPYNPGIPSYKHGSNHPPTKRHHHSKTKPRHPSPHYHYNKYHPHNYTSHHHSPGTYHPSYVSSHPPPPPPPPPSMLLLLLSQVGWESLRPRWLDRLCKHFSLFSSRDYNLCAKFYLLSLKFLVYQLLISM